MIDSYSVPKGFEVPIATDLGIPAATKPMAASSAFSSNAIAAGLLSAEREIRNVAVSAKAAGVEAAPVVGAAAHAMAGKAGAEILRASAGARTIIAYNKPVAKRAASDAMGVIHASMGRLRDAMADPVKRRLAYAGSGLAILIGLGVVFAEPAVSYIDAWLEHRAAEARLETARKEIETAAIKRKVEEQRRAQIQDAAPQAPSPPPPVTASRPAEPPQVAAQQPPPTPVIPSNAPQPQAKTTVGAGGSISSPPVVPPAPIVPVVPPPPSPITGEAAAINTANVTVAGQNLQLYGVRPVLHPGAEASFKGYLKQAGPVECLPVGQDFACKVVAKGYDLSEMVVLSGLATALPDAPARIRNAENEAKRNKSGVWRQ